jgi:hypothetical protein
MTTNAIHQKLKSARKKTIAMTTNTTVGTSAPRICLSVGVPVASATWASS